VPGLRQGKFQEHDKKSARWRYREYASYNIRKMSGTGIFWTADSTEKVPDTEERKLQVQDRESARTIGRESYKYMTRKVSGRGTGRMSRRGQ
jgi:hypothetical protein